MFVHFCFWKNIIFSNRIYLKRVYLKKDEKLFLFKHILTKNQIKILTLVFIFLIF